MTINILRTGGTHRLARHLLAITFTILVVPYNLPLSAQQQQQAQQPTTDQGAKIPVDQLDALVAPIALYPDNLLSQTLVASTYPLELMQLQQWLQRNQNLKDKALADAAAKQPWDPSVQAMAGLPQVVKRLTDDIQWTTDLGNAFLAQQGDVMNAIQRMRVKAKDDGALASNQQQKVETKVEDGKTVVVVEQAQPNVVYVPEYNPTAVWGEPAYPYPSIYYPSYTGGAIAASAISFGAGVAMGAFWGGGGWGWGAGWGHNDIDMNFNNSFNRNANVNRSATGARSNTWQHNPQHRGGAPYSNRATANRYGSNARGDSLASRQKGAQQQIARQKGNLGSVGDRGAVGGRAGGGRAAGGTIGGGASRGTTSLGSSRGLSGGDRVGSRSLGSSSSARSSGFGGGSGGFSGRSARSSSSRGSSSMRSSGGGRSRGGGGGGGRGGGGRGGGGGGRGGGRR